MTPEGLNPVDSKGNELSPTALAAALAAALIGLVLVLSLLAPKEQVVDLEQMEKLVAEGLVDRVEIVEGGIIARLRQPVAIQQESGKVRAQDVILPTTDESVTRDALDRWRATGISAVMNTDAGDRRRLQEMAWVSIVVGLLLFGVYHLVQQARKHRREGSPRERLVQVQDDLDAGRLSQAEFEQLVSEITPEL